ncbi:hypothetical protein CFC21_041377 [Triticum aestivum]|uniref:Endonuclease/exonuclease/phosphatase domain-containing protein n=2 Tax=Triticum aestivum TaxID=4565 RepID=A0A3B6FQA4_WHEAT|nr:hypothetical protein CFC21_041377 [Triticum aestivum]
MIENLCPILSWNIRGLNLPARRATVAEVDVSHRLGILCLQETKISTWTAHLAREVGGARLRDCVVLPAFDTRGGVAILWDPDVVEITSHAIGQFAITAQARLKASGKTF